MQRRASDPTLGLLPSLAETTQQEKRMSQRRICWLGKRPVVSSLVVCVVGA